MKYKMISVLLVIAVLSSGALGVLYYTSDQFSLEQIGLIGATKSHGIVLGVIYCYPWEHFLVVTEAHIRSSQLLVPRCPMIG